jgi:hypothetical protein
MYWLDVVISDHEAIQTLIVFSQLGYHSVPLCIWLTLVKSTLKYVP